ncbi:hypothetical protein [Ferruginibacter profundus]
MYKIEWYSETVKADSLPEHGFGKIKGRKYNFYCNNKTGYVIYKDDIYNKVNIQVAIGEFEGTKLILRREGTFNNNQLKIYDRKTNTCIGLISHNFIYRTLALNYYKCIKTVFNKNYGYDLRFDIYTGTSNTILSMLINKIKRKWYRWIYFVNIEGVIVLEDDPNWEFILCIFFKLHHVIQLERETD